jgi:hypothetical protein
MGDGTAAVAQSKAPDFLRLTLAGSARLEAALAPFIGWPTTTSPADGDGTHAASRHDVPGSARQMTLASPYRSPGQ